MPASRRHGPKAECVRDRPGSGARPCRHRPRGAVQPQPRAANRAILRHGAPAAAGAPTWNSGCNEGRRRGGGKCERGAQARGIARTPRSNPRAVGGPARGSAFAPAPQGAATRNLCSPAHNLLEQRTVVAVMGSHPRARSRRSATQRATAPYSGSYVDRASGTATV